LSEQINDFPLFSPIPWASAAMLNERYSSPPADSISAATGYPMSNGVNSNHHDEIMAETAEPSSPTLVTTGTPPPIDAVDVGIVPDSVARAVQEAGPPPRGPEDVNVSAQDRASDSGVGMEVD
jgi:hypothetical protein